MHVFEEKNFVWLNPTKSNFKNMIYIVMYFFAISSKVNYLSKHYNKYN